jgi:multidrug efflux pump subunit AcrA (membrane-fusion protein)
MVVGAMIASSILQFESALEKLDQAARRGDSLPQLLASSQAALLTLVSQGDILIEVFEQGRLRLRTSTLCESECDSIVAQLADLKTAGRLLTERRQLSTEFEFVAHFLIGLPDVVNKTGVDHQADNSRLMENAVQTLADVLAESSTRQLLADLTEWQRNHECLSPFVHELARCQTSDEWSAAVAQRGVQYLGRGRVSVLQRQQDCWHVVAATGSVTISRQSDALQRNERTATLIQTQMLTGSWLRTGSPDAGGSQHLPEEIRDSIRSEELRTLIAQYAAIGVKAIRLETISGNSGNLVFAVLIEVFDLGQLPSASMVELIRHEVGEAARLLPRSGFVSPGRRLKTRLWKVAAVAIVVLVLMLFVPTDFGIEVDGRAFPIERRRIFAPDDGIVEQLLVTSEQQVKAADELLRLRNPTRDLELTQVIGEIDSVIARQQAIRATRTTAGTGSSGSSSSRAADLSIEEQQLEQKLAALRQEQILIEQQISALTIRSPIRGMVYQRRLHEQLIARPVQRGELLMEIVDVDGPWEVQIQIPESVVGYVQQARTSSDESQSVHLSTAGDFQSMKSSRLQALDLATHLENGQLTCLATAEVDQFDVSRLRAGQSIMVQIHCGRRSLAFVWFREIVEFLQRKRFAWL